MSRNTLSFALPESMRAYIDARVASGPARPLTRADEHELLAIARGEID